MNLRSYITIETTKEDRTYVMSVPFGAKYNEAFQVAHEFASTIEEMARQDAERAKNQESVDPEIVVKE